MWTIAALGLLFGLGAREVRHFENLAAQDIASKLEGPAKTVSVRSEFNGVFGVPSGDFRRVRLAASHFSTPGLPLFCEPELSTRGKVRQLRIVLDDFFLAGLRVEHLEADIPDCRYDFGLALDKKKIRLSRSGVGNGTVRLLEKDLETFLLKKFRELKSVSVKIDRNRAWVKGHGEFIVVKTDFEVIAKLVPVDGTKLMLAEARVFFGDFVADDSVKELVLRTLNPIVDLDKDLGLYGAVQVEGLTLENGVLEAWGKTRIPDRPKGISPPGDGTRP